MTQQSVLTGPILDQDCWLTLSEICQAFGIHAELIVEMVEEGILEPMEHDVTPWRFRGHCMRRVRTTLRLRDDLHVNMAGAALALQLLDEIEMLRNRLEQNREP